MKKFLDAISSGNAQLVSRLIDSIDTTTVNEALVIVSKKGYIDTLKVLLKHPNLQLNQEILVNLVENNHVNCLRSLLNIPLLELSSLLRVAVKNKNARIVKLLLNNSPQIENRDINNALVDSIHNSDSKITNLLLKFGKIQSEDEILKCLKAIGRNGNIKIAHLFLEKYKIVQEEEFIRELLRKQHYRLLIWLVRSRKLKNPRFNDDFLLRRACGAGIKELVMELILLYDVDPRARNFEALENARNGGHEEIVKLLCDEFKLESSYKYI